MNEHNQLMDNEDKTANSSRAETDQSDRRGDKVEPKPSTLAEMLVLVGKPNKRQELEEYRIAFEAKFGETDLTRYYTSMWPEEQQAWLIEHEPQRYFDGLPPFAKAFLRGKLENTARKGNLDSIPDGFIRLFMSGRMDLGDRTRY